MTRSAEPTALLLQRLPRFLSQKRDFSGDGGLSHPPEEKETQSWFSGHDLARAQSRFSSRDLASKWASGYREARGPTSIYTKTTKHNNNNRSLTNTNYGSSSADYMSDYSVVPHPIPVPGCMPRPSACPYARMLACPRARVPVCPHPACPHTRMPACL